ncbi:MAG TPA: hypothetical protein DDY13_01120, partial [Cytophagales bacterium]|nr:hypothetical protein [Cytophagales bacterium]
MLRGVGYVCLNQKLAGFVVGGTYVKGYDIRMPEVKPGRVLKEAYLCFRYCVLMVDIFRASSE